MERRTPPVNVLALITTTLCISALPLVLALLPCSPARAQSPQTATTASQNPPPAPTLPFATQLKKTVVFLTVEFRDGAQIGHAEGTAFFVLVPSKSSAGSPHPDQSSGFSYLVTNRHMADPSVALGHPVTVLGFSIRANRVLTNGETGPLAIDLPLNPQWIYPSDPSVDLAIAPLGFNPAKLDILLIPETILATADVVKAQGVSEGDSVMFSGFFAQFPGQTRIEPVVREGVLAMLPDEEIPTTLGLPGHLYLADMHSFNGNSGSPVFVNLSGLRNGSLTFGEHMLLLGVVSGYMTESENFQLQAATTFIGRIGANSGITTIVPADELKSLLDSPILANQRDQAAAAQKTAAH